MPAAELSLYLMWALIAVGAVVAAALMLRGGE